MKKFAMLAVIIVLINITLAQTPTVERESFTVDFGDFQSQAELSYPVSETPLPTVILIHGSSPMDMDGSVFAFGPNGPEKLSGIFKDVTNYLNTHGFAVLRYNKHYVTGAGKFDAQKFYTQLDLQQMLEDAEVVLEAAQTNPVVDKDHIYLYGWSEGSTIAAELAARHPEVAGLVVQTPVTVPWREVFVYQALEVGLPYVRSFADDGKVSAETLSELFAGQGGLVAKGISNYLADASFYQTGQLKVNALLDANSDNVIDLEGEATPEKFAELIDSSMEGPLRIYGEEALPTVTEQAQAGKLNLPILILQGVNDANVPPKGATLLDEALAEAGNQDVTIKVYEGLGHSLGQASSRIDDNFRSIEEEPLEDLVAWLRTQAKYE